MAGDIGENLERQFHVRSFPVYEVTKYDRLGVFFRSSTFGCIINLIRSV